MAISHPAESRSGLRHLFFLVDCGPYNVEIYFLHLVAGFVETILPRNVIPWHIFFRPFVHSTMLTSVGTFAEQFPFQDICLVKYIITKQLRPSSIFHKELVSEPFQSQPRGIRDQW